MKTKTLNGTPHISIPDEQPDPWEVKLGKFLAALFVVGIIILIAILIIKGIMWAWHL